MGKQELWSSANFLIPALNEEESLPGVIRSLTDLGIRPTQILILDNGSQDSTPEIAKNLGTILIQERQRGYGAACLAGIRFLSESGRTPNYIVFMDADGSDDPKDLQSLFEIFQKESDTDFVIGSRILGDAEPGSLSFLQKFGNHLTCFLIRIFYGKTFTDLGPFRILKWNSLLELRLKDKTWGWNVEMQIKAVRKKYKIREVPVHYSKRKGGKSKISGNLIGSFRAGVKILWIFFRLIFGKTD